METMQLFHNTVHTVNAADYTREQLDAWAPKKMDEEQWNRSLLDHYAVVAITEDEIIGFGDISADGYLDRLFVHASYQRQGVADAICDCLEESCKGSITTQASITAKGFFLRRGYKIIRQQEVERRGIKLTNFLMQKTR